MTEHIPNKTTEDLVSEIVCDDISTIEDLVLSNDKITLEEWLTPLLTSDLRVRMGLSEGEPFTYEKCVRTASSTDTAPTVLLGKAAADGKSEAVLPGTLSLDNQPDAATDEAV